MNFTTPPLGKEFAVVDLETTGLDPSSDHIIEISVIIFKVGGSVHDQSTETIKIGFKVPPRIVELTGITDQELAVSKSFEDVMSRYLDKIGSRTVMAFNAKFDLDFLKAAAKRLKRQFNNDTWCVMEQAKSAYPWLPGGHSLRNVAEVLGLKADGLPHRAAHDTELAVRIFAAILQGKKPYGAENVKILLECSLRADPTKDIIDDLVLDPGIEHPKALREWAATGQNEPGHMWTRDGCEYINVYGPDGGYGQGVIVRIYKDKNPQFSARYSDDSKPIEVTMRQEGEDQFVLLFRDPLL